MKYSVWIGAVAYLLCFTLWACDTGKACDKVLCGYNQYCSKGSCYCVDGYEGNDCGTYSADKYIGSYLVSEYCSPSSPNTAYYVNVSYGFATNQLTFSNLFNSGLGFTGVIHTDESTNQGNVIYIQDNQGGISCSFQGYFYPDLQRIDMQGSYSMGFSSYDCGSFSLYKQ